MTGEAWVAIGEGQPESLSFKAVPSPNRSAKRSFFDEDRDYLPPANRGHESRIAG
jgi:hypothetical protein